MAVITKTTEAYVGIDANITSNGDVVIAARSEEDIASLSAALAAGGTAGIGGAAGVSVLNITTRAYIADAATPADGATVNAEGNVVISAYERTEMDVIAGNASAAGTASIGAAGVCT